MAVLGLGAMGTAIARTLTGADVPVRAWNRSSRSLHEVVTDAAAAGRLEIVTSLEHAVAGTQAVVVCVRDHEAANAVLAAAAPHLDGQVVVNVSTGTPDEAVESAARAAAKGMRYVTGAVMVPTAMVGTDDCVVLYAGTAGDVAAIGPLQRALGGTADYTGREHAVPPALDLAMLDIYFAGMYAHLHATALASAHGIAPDRFLPYAQGVVETLGGSLADLTTAVTQRTWDSGEARLDMCLAFLEHIVATSHHAGIAPGLAEHVRDASARALARVPGSTDWDVVALDFNPSAAGTTRERRAGADADANVAPAPQS